MNSVISDSSFFSKNVSTLEISSRYDEIHIAVSSSDAWRTSLSLSYYYIRKAISWALISGINSYSNSSNNFIPSVSTAVKSGNF